MAIDILCDIRPRFGPARDQGPRPTCLAFAISDAHAALREPWTRALMRVCFLSRAAASSEASDGWRPIARDASDVEGGWAAA
jgi:hypothetical protein